ncbi:MAG: alpha/beta fold hydrolase [Lysobacterales bacterium]
MYEPPAELYPFKRHWLDVSGQRLHYLDEGPRDAPIVLMVHGNPTWSFYYRNLVLSLSGRYRCIVPDHIGCGLSAKPAEQDYPYTLMRRIADLGELMRHIRPAGPVHLVVHDWGGMIGLGWARASGVASLVITNTAAFPLPPGKKFPMALKLARSPLLGRLLVQGLNAFAAGAARLAFAKPVAKAIRRAYTGPYDSWRNRVATLRFVRDIPLGPDDGAWAVVKSTEARLADFSGKPCLLAWGEKDFVFDRHFLERWQTIFPRAEVNRYPDCGHYLLEDAGPPLAEAIGRFIDNHA